MREQGRKVDGRLRVTQQEGITDIGIEAKSMCNDGWLRGSRKETHMGLFCLEGWEYTTLWHFFLFILIMLLCCKFDFVVIYVFFSSNIFFL